MRDLLISEKAVNAGLRTKLETAAEKIQTICEFKRAEHSSWDPDEEI